MMLSKQTTHWQFCLILLILLSQHSLASHEKNEPSDGTVNSFRWVQNPVGVPEISFSRGDGTSISLGHFRGRVVLLNLWASWCPPCIRELPALGRLQKRLGGEDFEVVAVSLDEDPESAREMLYERVKVDGLKLYTDSQKRLGQFFPVDVLPANYFIDREGRVLGLLRSYVDWDDPRVERLVEQLIQGVPAERLDSGTLIKNQ